MPKIFSTFARVSRTSKLIAIAVTIVVLVVGYILLRSSAAGFFTSSEAEQATVSTNAKIISDETASGGKAVQFNAPTTPVPPTTPPPTGTTSCPLPKYPDETCTGLASAGVLEANLTPKKEIIIVRTPGTVIEGIRLEGCIGVEAPDVIIRKSKIICTDGDAIVYNGEGGGRLLVEDTEITCAGALGTAIVHSNYTAKRLNIHDCGNGFKMAHDATIEDSLIHDLISYDPITDPHVDGIESVDGSRSTINHNTIYGTNSKGSIGNAAVNINASGGGPTTTNLVISNNLLAGGGYTLYCSGSNSINFQVINNHFSTKFHPKVGLYGVSTECGSNEIKSGNVYHETIQAMMLN